MTRTIGLIVNPISGMGGAVGLHGTDGRDVLAEARARGATAAAGPRARRALAILAAGFPQARILAAPGPMGAALGAGFSLAIEPLGERQAPTVWPLGERQAPTVEPLGERQALATDLPGERRASTVEPPAAGPHRAAVLAQTTAADTKNAAAALAERGVAAILFAGGDGTARDIASVVGLNVPLLGIPTGVKMQSGVFATSPEAAGRIVADLLAGDRRIGFRKVEVMDIDEEARRAGRLGARLYGYARAPHARSLLQAAKAAPLLSDDAALDAACVETARDLGPGVTWLIGPGTTAKKIVARLGEGGTLLGVDAVRDGQVIGRDLTEAESLAAAGEGPVGIVVGVTGGQGFVFGRGNQQIGADAIRRAWPDRLIILASEGKLAALPEPRLLVDTGDPALDAAMEGWARVRTGPRRATLMRLVR